MRISDSEMEIMKLIWRENGAVTTAMLLDRLDNGWKQTTVLTFLKRLADKGALSIRREGKTNYYSPKISEADYKRQQTEAFLREVHAGSVKRFLAALYGGVKPSASEMEEIKQWFEEEM